MKTNLIILISIISGILFSCCTSKESAVEVIKINGEEFYVCDFTKVKDSLVIPLSDLVKDLHIIKLENRDGALLGSSFFYFYIR